MYFRFSTDNKVFQYRSGAKLRMSCGVNFAPAAAHHGRRRRAAVAEIVDEIDEEFSVTGSKF